MSLGRNQMSDSPKGRDIMAVFHFYNGDVIEQKIPGCPEDKCDEVIFSCFEVEVAAFDNGVIRCTKDIEKVVWSYC